MKRYTGEFVLSNGCTSFFNSYADGAKYFHDTGWVHHAQNVKGTDGKYHKKEWFERGMLTAKPLRFK